MRNLLLLLTLRFSTGVTMLVSLHLRHRETHAVEYIGYATTLEAAIDWYTHALASSDPIFTTYFTLAESIMMMNTAKESVEFIVVPGFYAMMDLQELQAQIDSHINDELADARQRMDDYRNNIEPKVLTHATSSSGTLQ